MTDSEQLQRLIASGGQPPAAPTQFMIQLPQPEQWRVFAIRVGGDEFKPPRLMFEGSFQEVRHLVEFLEGIPTATLPAPIASIQAPQPFHVRAVGPRITMDLKNKKFCRVSFNDSDGA